MRPAIYSYATNPQQTRPARKKKSRTLFSKNKSAPFACSRFPGETIFLAVHTTNPRDHGGHYNRWGSENDGRFPVVPVREKCPCTTQVAPTERA